MGWNIPEVPQKKPLTKLNYTAWLMFLMLILTANVVFILLFRQSVNYLSVLLYGMLPSFLGWLCFFGVRLNRYEQSVADCLSWNEEKLKTEFNWQQWSRKQLVVVANSVYTPDENGVDALLGSVENIPAYPKKPRRLFSARRSSFSSTFNYLHDDLEGQCPGFQAQLHDVYLLCTDGFSVEDSVELLFKRWSLYPKIIKSINEIQFLFDMDFEGLIMIACLNAFSESSTLTHSEFISAQLISSTVFAEKRSLPVIAGLGRIMPLAPEGLEDNLDVLVRYNRLDGNKLKHFWLSGADDDVTETIMRFSVARKWQLPKRQPLHLPDYSYGPPGPLSFPVYLSLLTDSAKKTEMDQLIIFYPLQKSQQPYLCLITRRLFS